MHTATLRNRQPSRYNSRLKRSREGIVLALLIPLSDPFVRAERVVSALELLARRELLALGSNALEVVGVVLEAMPRLVRVGEAGVKASRLQDVFAGEVRHGGSRGGRRATGGRVGR